MRKPYVWIISLAVILGLSAVFYFNKPQEVQTGVAVLHSFTTFIEGSGTVDAPKQTILVPSNGLIKSVPVAEGQHVEAGDAVLQMDDEALKLQLEQATLSLNAQKKAYDKQNKALTDAEKQTAMLAAQTTGYGLNQFNSAVQGADAQTVSTEQVDMARIQVEQAAWALQNAIVYSSIEGTVLDVSARAGEFAAAGFQAALVASMDAIEIDSVFADLDASTISPGMEVQLYGGCLGSATCGGTVTKIVPKAETQQSQTGVKSAAVIKIKPEKNTLFTRLGASVELKVITGKKSGVGVPIEALAQDSSGLYVFIIKNGRAYRTPVEVGVLDEYYAEMKTGVQQGDTVALNPTELRDGQKVSGS
jgi:HlyD family secretion protein